MNLRMYTNSDWAGCPVSRQSTSGYCIFFARSSIEAEYRRLASGVAELTWIQYLLRDLHITLPSVPIAYCDNIAATYLAYKPITHSRTKHIMIDLIIILFTRRLHWELSRSCMFLHMRNSLMFSLSFYPAQSFARPLPISVVFAQLQLREDVHVNNISTNYLVFQVYNLGTDNSVCRHGIHGLYRLFNIEISSSLLVQGDNCMYLSQERGGDSLCGILYDYLRLEGPSNE
ncbi:hypothetical protein LIER_36289 [Lithospermum erythrorhizon]|uniref:Rhamnogalacturonan lyase domain-containing protein n=1 Tax=Lithospermum erythrorhizon TaxID=34254 RepID=A0AAV3P427_LITER